MDICVYWNVTRKIGWCLEAHIREKQKLQMRKSSFWKIYYDIRTASKKKCVRFSLSELRVTRQMRKQQEFYCISFPRLIWNLITVTPHVIVINSLLFFFTKDIKIISSTVLRFQTWGWGSSRTDRMCQMFYENHSFCSLFEFKFSVNL